jgi:uncharacterized protein with von Willebrand factor type A (vWA) domain
MADLPAIVARFSAAVHAAGLPVGPDRAERFARAITVAMPSTLTGLRACAHATLAYSHDHIAVLDRVFDAVFAGLVDPADDRGDPGQEAISASGSAPPPAPGLASGAPSASAGSPARDSLSIPTAGSVAERLRHKDFSELTPEELLLLADAMATFRLVTPQRWSRRSRPADSGHRFDLRATLRAAQRTGGDPVWLARRRKRLRPRRLVVLCDISGSMEPYARALLQLLYCATRTTRAEVFTFATRLTRLTPALASQSPAIALASASAAAPDWSGGTRIGANIKEFIDEYGRRGIARGAVVLVISDGWDTGDPALLGEQMARLARLAHRIVWANPRTQSASYRPLVGGMAAAWPYCDAVVSAHRLDALDDLVGALRG